jgi:GT2 family glycosyltransferase
MPGVHNPNIAVVLVNYRRANDTLACVASLRKSNYTDYRIVIIDNSPDDDLSKLMRERFPDIPVFAPGVNLGFAAGNNLGIRYALESSCDAVLLLNNDTEVDPGAIAALARVLQQGPETGIVGGKIYFHSSPSKIWFAGGHFNVNSGFGGHDGIGQRDHGQFDARRECDFITGCCQLIRRSVLESIGLLDEQFFAYLEDVDFCHRARQAGYHIMYAPDARVYHKISSTAAWDSPVYLYFNARNKLLLLKKHATILSVLPHLPRLCWFYLRQTLRMAVKYRDMDGLKAVWMGLADGIARRTGEHGSGRLAYLGPGKKRNA